MQMNSRINTSANSSKVNDPKSEQGIPYCKAGKKRHEHNAESIGFLCSKKLEISLLDSVIVDRNPVDFIPASPCKFAAVVVLLTAERRSLFKRKSRTIYSGAMYYVFEVQYVPYHIIK